MKRKKRRPEATIATHTHTAATCTGTPAAQMVLSTGSKNSAHTHSTKHKHGQNIYPYFYIRIPHKSHKPYTNISVPPLMYMNILKCILMKKKHKHAHTHTDLYPSVIHFCVYASAQKIPVWVVKSRRPIDAHTNNALPG